MEANILVSYDPRGGYLTGRNEIHDILTKLGDQKSDISLIVPGIIGVTTKLKARDAIEEVKELFLSDPRSVNSALKWVPVDAWCDETVESIKKLVSDDIKNLIVEDDLFKIDVIKHKSELHTDEIVEAIAPLLKGKVELDHPQKILRIDLFGRRSAVTLLKPKDIFSITKH